MEQNKLAIARKIQHLINEAEGPRQKKLSKNQKRQFAYSFWNISDEDITDLYNFLAEEQTPRARKIARRFELFMDNQSITKMRRFDSMFFEQDIDYIKQVTQKLKNNGNWLSLYNIDHEFSQDNPYAAPIIYSYLINDGETFTIDQNRADHILGMLTEANIPTAKCIVKDSFPYYARGEMDKYVKKITSTK